MDNYYNKEKYLKLLSKEYKNINEVAEEIINLQAIINLQKRNRNVFKRYTWRISNFCTYFK